MTVVDPPEPMITASNAIPGLTSNEYAAQNRFCCELPCLIAASNLDFRVGPSTLIKLRLCTAVWLETWSGALAEKQAASSNESNIRLFIIRSFLRIIAVSRCERCVHSRSGDGATPYRSPRRYRDHFFLRRSSRNAIASGSSLS